MLNGYTMGFYHVVTFIKSQVFGLMLTELLPARGPWLTVVINNPREKCKTKQKTTTTNKQIQIKPTDK